MASKQEELRLRTKRFALRVIRLVRALPRNTEGYVIGRQLLRSGTSAAANYRAAGRARSKAEFIARMGVVVEEADETVFWLDLLKEAGTIPAQRLEDLMNEAHQLLAIFAASQETARRGSGRKPL
jgi:four helix bundle protein